MKPAIMPRRPTRLAWLVTAALLAAGRAGIPAGSLLARAAEPWTLKQALDYARVHNPDARIALQRIAAAQAGLEQAAESASLTRNRFEQGLALPTQLIDAETALVAARVRRAETESDERIAVAALRKALALPQLDPRPAAR